VLTVLRCVLTVLRCVLTVLRCVLGDAGAGARQPRGPAHALGDGERRAGGSAREVSVSQAVRPLMHWETESAALEDLLAR
jgi:hypothetical protein